MRGHPIACLLAAAVLLPMTAYACNPRAHHRVVKGRQPAANTLYAHIRGVGAGSWQAGFDTETFVYVGDVHAKSGKTYKIGYLKTIAGRQCITFERLFIFDAKDKYLGQYPAVEVDARKIKIQGSALVFPFQDGNKLDLKDGPPAEVRLDGAEIGWEAAPPAPDATPSALTPLSPSDKARG